MEIRGRQVEPATVHIGTFMIQAVCGRAHDALVKNEPSQRCVIGRARNFRIGVFKDGEVMTAEATFLSIGEANAIAMFRSSGRGEAVLEWSLVLVQQRGLSTEYSVKPELAVPAVASEKRRQPSTRDCDESEQRSQQRSLKRQISCTFRRHSIAQNACARGGPTASDWNCVVEKQRRNEYRGRYFHDRHVPGGWRRALKVPSEDPGSPPFLNNREYAKNRREDEHCYSEVEPESNKSPENSR
jgi:hypothetical protein